MSLLRGAIYGVVLAVAGCSIADEPLKFLCLLLALNVPDIISAVER